MEKIYYKNEERIKTEKARIETAVKLLNENRSRLEKINRVRHVLDADLTFQITYGGIDKITAYFSRLNPLTEKHEVEALVYVLTTPERLDVKYPELKGMEPLTQVRGTDIAGRSLKESDFVYDGTKQKPSDETLAEIEEYCTYRAETEDQKLFVKLTDTLADTIRKLAGLHAKHGLYFVPGDFTRQILNQYGEAPEIDKVFVSEQYLPLFK